MSPIHHPSNLLYARYIEEPATTGSSIGGDGERGRGGWTSVLRSWLYYTTSPTPPRSIVILNTEVLKGLAVRMTSAYVDVPD